MKKIDGKYLGQIMWYADEISDRAECERDFDNNMGVDLCGIIKATFFRGLGLDLAVRIFNMADRSLRGTVGWVL